MASNGSDDEKLVDIFQEPPDYYQPEKPHQFVEYNLKAGNRLSLRLLGHSPLWGHLLWNAAQIVTTHLEDNADHIVKGKNVLELGAGAGLPSLACAILGASIVVASDYPEPALIENIGYNIDHCEGLPSNANVFACGYLWGDPIEPLTAHLEDPNSRFDLLILADILFNHSEHGKLVRTLQLSLRKSSEAVALVFFTPYRPWLLEKDLNFFTLAQEHGFLVNRILEHTMERVMFEEDPGDEQLRRTVFGYEVRWNL